MAVWENKQLYFLFHLIVIWFSSHLWWLIISKEFYFQVTEFMNKRCSCARPRSGVTTQCRYPHNEILLILITVWMDMLIMQKINKILTRKCKIIGGQIYQQSICLYNTNPANRWGMLMLSLDILRQWNSQSHQSITMQSCLIFNQE